MTDPLLPPLRDAPIQHVALAVPPLPFGLPRCSELLHQRGTLFSHETLREWCLKFSPLFADNLDQQKPRRGFRWLMDEGYTTVNSVRHWLWRANDEPDFVLDSLLRRHGDAATTFLTRLPFRSHSNKSALKLRRCPAGTSGA
ncbi:IS6 family transposase [Deinococcus sp. KSM4-11]|uniref:IS6 family transposase n=1 Tax=Deinococcus sp. KSM4-11 TaxID=2568654 RepID=UPI0010A50F6E|nr:IS6 family transposase [Deinococcus sp. KSM4-11]THF84350.1 IS6 family transposase [Deinococcus sp. KSM4-11]